MAQATIETTVAGIQGIPVSATPPTVNQQLVYNGTNWVPMTLGPFLPLAGGTITGALTVDGNITSNTGLVAPGIQSTAGSVGIVSQSSSLDVGVTITVPGVRNWVCNIAAASGNFYIMDVSAGGISRMTLDLLGTTNIYSESAAQDCSLLLGQPIGGWSWKLTAQGGGNNNFLFYNNSGGAICGWMEASSNILYWNFDIVAPSFVQSSDPKTKKDIEDAPSGALETVTFIPVKRYHRLNDESSAPLRTGWLSTDVEKIYPDAVITNADLNKEKQQGLNVGDMTAILWQAVQELAAQVKVLQGKIA